MGYASTGMPKRNHRSAVAIYDAQSNIFFVFVVRHHALFIVGGNSAPNSVKHTWSETLERRQQSGR